MNIIFENRIGLKVEKPTTLSHTALGWYYDDHGNFHLVLRNRSEMG